MADYFGNVSKGNMPFIKIKEPVINIERIGTDKGAIIIGINELDCTNADTVEVMLMDEQFQVLFKGKLNPAEKIFNRNLRLNMTGNDVQFVEFKIKKNGMDVLRKKFSIAPVIWPENRDIDFNVIVNREYMYIKIKNKKITSENILLSILQGDAEIEVNPRYSADGIYFLFEPLNTETDLRMNFSLISNGQIYSKISKRIRVLPLEFGQKQQFKWDEFEAEFAEKSVREPRILLVKKVLFDSKFPILSGQFDLSPYHFPFLDMVRYKIKKKVEKPFQVSLFKYNHKRKVWGAVYSPYHKRSHTFSTKVRSSGTYALMRDIFPPEIKFRKPRRRRKKSIRYLNIFFSDKGKGIDDSTIEILLNGYPVKDEYDPDWRRVRVTDLRSLKRGKNTLKIKVKDYAKHETRKVYTFYLK